MGMSYDDLGLYGRLRKVARCGPVAMYRRCLAMWRGALGPDAVADKARRSGEGGVWLSACQAARWPRAQPGLCPG
jgi:hypothetical protein